MHQARSTNTCHLELQGCEATVRMARQHQSSEWKLTYVCPSCGQPVCLRCSTIRTVLRPGSIRICQDCIGDGYMAGSSAPRRMRTSTHVAERA